MLVNPWARSSAFGDAGISSVNGLEATFTNIAGLAFTDKTQIKFNYSNTGAQVTQWNQTHAEDVGEGSQIAKIIGKAYIPVAGFRIR